MTGRDGSVKHAPRQVPQKVQGDCMLPKLEAHGYGISRNGKCDDGTLKRREAP